MQRLLQKARKTRRRRRRKNGNAGRNGQLEKREQMGKNKTCFRFSYGSICFFYGSNCFSHGSTCFPPESIRLSRVFPPSWNVPAGEDRTAGSVHHLHFNRAAGLHPEKDAAVATPAREWNEDVNARQDIPMKIWLKINDDILRIQTFDISLQTG